MNRMLFLRDIVADVLIRCRACGHEGVLPHAEAEHRFGPGYPVLSIAPHFRCSKCNSRDCESMAAPLGDTMTPLAADVVPAPSDEDDEQLRRLNATIAALQGLSDAAHDAKPPSRPGWLDSMDDEEEEAVSATPAAPGSFLDGFDDLLPPSLGTPLPRFKEPEDDAEAEALAPVEDEDDAGHMAARFYPFEEPEIPAAAPPPRRETPALPERPFFVGRERRRRERDHDEPARKAIMPVQIPLDDVPPETADGRPQPAAVPPLAEEDGGLPPELRALLFGGDISENKPQPKPAIPSDWADDDLADAETDAEDIPAFLDFPDETETVTAPDAEAAEGGLAIPDAFRDDESSVRAVDADSEEDDDPFLSEALRRLLHKASQPEETDAGDSAFADLPSADPHEDIGVDAPGTLPDWGDEEDVEADEASGDEADGDTLPLAEPAPDAAPDATDDELPSEEEIYAFALPRRGEEEEDEAETAAALRRLLAEHRDELEEELEPEPELDPLPDLDDDLEPVPAARLPVQAAGAFGDDDDEDEVYVYQPGEIDDSGEEGSPVIRPIDKTLDLENAADDEAPNPGPVAARADDDLLDLEKPFDLSDILGDIDLDVPDHDAPDPEGEQDHAEAKAAKPRAPADDDDFEKLLNPPAWKTQRPPPIPGEDDAEMEDALATLRALIEEAAAEPEEDGDPVVSAAQKPVAAREPEPRGSFADLLAAEMERREPEDDTDVTLPPRTPLSDKSLPIKNPQDKPLPVSAAEPITDGAPKKKKSLDDTLSRLRGLLDLPGGERGDDETPSAGRGSRRRR